jgi:isochorismate hydrolase
MNEVIERAKRLLHELQEYDISLYNRAEKLPSYVTEEMTALEDAIKSAEVSK